MLMAEVYVYEVDTALTKLPEQVQRIENVHTIGI
jgi:hypothetical protein